MDLPIMPYVAPMLAMPLRPERVVEVRYDHMEGNRSRHTARFVCWRPDRDARSCDFSQLEEPVRYDLCDVLRGGHTRGSRTG